LKNKLASKAIASVVMGILFGLYVHHDYAKWGQRGREAFLQNQLQRFDRFMAHPHAIVPTMIGATILIIGGLVIYELLVFVTSRILNPGRSE
jgi:hypothetical protein